MGYTTYFKGELRFNRALTDRERRIFATMAGEDVRDHPEWELPGDAEFYYVDLELTEDGRGVRHNRAEKTRDVPGQVNFVLMTLRKTAPDLGLRGSMLAQGEETGDVWRLTIGGDGWARKDDEIA